MSSKIWHHSGNAYSPGTTAAQLPKLPGGIYKVINTPLGWFLELKELKFTFPYKIYGTHDRITNRVSKAWEGLNGNLGILLNGLKGTGKTVTAQLVGNWASENDTPVIVIDSPLPNLSDVLKRIDQDLVVFFDEFEKTHNSEHQQALLSSLDGNARTEYKRLFLLTTNNPNLDENMQDRPSRIRYTWNFEGLTPDLIMEIIDDLLHPELSEFSDSILQYVSTRRVQSIDVVKAVINEVNQFEEGPEAFEEIFNLTKLNPHYFTVSIVEDGKEHVVMSEFLPRFIDDTMMNVGSTRSWKDFNSTWTENHEEWVCNEQDGKTGITVLEAVQEPGMYRARIRVRANETELDKAMGLNTKSQNNTYQLDKKPKDWNCPDFTNDEGNPDSEKIKNYFANDSIYGTDVIERIIRITPEFNAPQWVKNAYNRHSC
jgi:hypothetical protein